MTSATDLRRRESSARAARRRLHPPTPAAAAIRVADVAMFYGERSGGIRTYLDAKVRWARTERRIEHHVIVPGRGTRLEPGRHELPSLRVIAANGYRLPIGAAALKATLHALRPDVILLHDPFWQPLGVTRTARELGARVVAVHHGSTALDAAGLPGPDAAWKPLLRAWMHHAYRDVDAVMSAVPCAADCGREATIPLRFGLHPAFSPQRASPAGTTSSTRAGSPARRASTSWWRPPPEPRSRGRCGCSGAGRSCRGSSAERTSSGSATGSSRGRSSPTRRDWRGPTPGRESS